MRQSLTIKYLEANLITTFAATVVTTTATGINCVSNFNRQQLYFVYHCELLCVYLRVKVTVNFLDFQLYWQYVPSSDHLQWASMQKLTKFCYVNLYFLSQIETLGK